MSLKRRVFKSDRTFISSAAIALMLATAGLTGCQTGEVLNGGYIFDQQSLDLVPVGSSREQVLLSLGTPSTTATDRKSTRLNSSHTVLSRMPSSA